MDLRYLLYGGDKRSLYLAKLLLCDGGDVRCFALEKAELPDGARHTQGVTDADCVILPVPAAENGLLKAPFSQSPHKLTDIVSAVGAGTLLCGGCCVPLKKGDSFFLPAGSGPFRIDGNAEGVLTTV